VTRNVRWIRWIIFFPGSPGSPHPQTFRQLQDMLYNDLKIKSGTLHPGKYVVADAGNIQLIDHPKFWIDASETF
jgi:hypothetical protein